MTVVGKDPHAGQIVAVADFKVVRVVGRGDLHHAGTLFHIGVLVLDDRDLLIDKRQDHVAAL